MTTTPEQAVIQADLDLADALRDLKFLQYKLSSHHPEALKLIAAHRLAHSQPASEGLREICDGTLTDAQPILAALQPLTEPQRLGQEGEQS